MTAVVRGWEVKPLGQLVEVLDSERIPVSARERAERPGLVPYYGATGQVGTIAGKIFDEPLLLLGEDGVKFFDREKPKAYRIDGPSWVNNHAHVLRTRPECDQRFLEHYLNAFDYRGYANGTTRLKLTQAAMRKIPVLLPPMLEQLRIVDILEDHFSRLDAADEYIAASLRRAKLMADAVRSSAVSDAANSPSQWKQMTLGDIARWGSGGTPTAGRADYYGGDIPWAVIGDLNDGVVSHTRSQITDLALTQSTAKLLPPGVLLVAMYGSIGKLGITGTHMATNQAIAFAHMHPFMDVRFVFHYLAAQRSKLIAAGKGATQKNIGQATLKQWPIRVPPIDEQRRIAVQVETQLSALSAIAQQVATTSQHTTRLRQGLLLAAFSGRLTGRQGDDAVIEELAHV